MKISNNTCGGKCSNCGECCMPLIPITLSEYKVIKEYIKEHHISPQDVHISGNDVRLDCPFHDIENKKCNIYPVRPEVCKAFLCSTGSVANKYDKRADINGSSNKLVPLDFLFYGLPIGELLLYQHLSQENYIYNDPKYIDIIKSLVRKWYKLDGTEKLANGDYCILHFIHKTSRALRKLPIDNQPLDIAEAIIKGDIKLEWSD